MGRERELAEIIGATGINVPSADTFQVSGVARVGNNYIDVPDGATGSRPGTPSVGMLYFNTTTDNLEQYTSGGWAAIEQPPTVTSISPTSSTVTGTSITFTGTGYKAGCTVTFVGTDGVALSAGSVSITNATTLVATTPALPVANEPYDCKVTSPGGLTGQLTDGLDAGGTPTWTTASGSLGSIRDDATGTHFTLVATDPDGGAITYAETTSVLSGAGFSLNSTTGAITGDPTDVGTSTDYNFTVSATDPSANAVNRSFIITVTPSYHLLASAAVGGETQFFQADVLNTQQTTTFTLRAIGANVTFATKAWAGGGGGSANAPAIGGGAGAQFGTYTLNENDYIFVQCAGGGGGDTVSTSGGAGGGGGVTGQGGGGGGYSGFFTGQSAVHGNSVLLAGGGGGGAYYDHAGGHGGGSSGGVGKNSGGGGGTQSAGGAATTNPQAGGSSQAGSALSGGAGGPSGGHGGGGGGGGGYYGGGGGSGYSNNLGSRGGGGGSGYAAGTLSSITQTSGADATGVPGESADTARNGAGTGGPQQVSGSDGRIYITVS
jgi:hypothetical protein